MAIWGTGSFENHAAMDWLVWLRHSSGLIELRRALEESAGGVPGRDVVTCRRGIAAAELVAALHGNAAIDLPEEARAWIVVQREVPDEALVTLAVGIVAAIAVESELYAQWCQGHEREEADWLTVIADLNRRLSSPSARTRIQALPSEKRS